MAGKQARILSEAAIRSALRQVARSTSPERDRVIVLLSVRAGLRACEIAGLTWEMLLDSQGRLAGGIDLHDRVAKGSSGRRVPLHPELAAALRILKRSSLPRGPVIKSARGGALHANSVVNWFLALFARVGAEGCSSHSGRRTFITQAARRAHTAGATLRDVQLLAGHRSIETTQRYIEGDTDAQRRLVCAL